MHVWKKRLSACLLVLAACAVLITPYVDAAGGYDEDGWTGSGHVHNYSGEQVRAEPTCEEAGYTGTRCTRCASVRKDQTLAALGHDYQNGACTRCQAADPDYVAGDFTGDGAVNNDDVVQLLWYTLFPEQYPLPAHGDLTGDGCVNNEDVVHLLWNILFPEEYPLT